MKNIILIIALTFAFPIFNSNAQREYAYCHAMHVYQVPYTFFTPTLLTLVINETDANPYNKLTCPTTNNLAVKYFKKGLGNIHQYNYLSRRGENKPKQEFHLNMATVYFAGAIKSDSAFCDAYDNLVNCFYLRKMYDSAIRVVDNQAEIQQALAEYQQNQFGGWPWPSPEHVHPRGKGRFAKYPDGREETRV